MSALVAFLRRDGGVATRKDIAGALATLAHRGPDVTRGWCLGPVALAAAQFRTTPQSLHESLPLADGASGVAVVHDARLDNRAALARSLDIAEGTLGRTGDGELLVRAWQRWGERCPEHLVGDFAFAIWDDRKQELFAARDHVGMRLLYGFVSPAVAAFASEIKALLALPGVPRRLNPERVADYLLGVSSDPRSTFYGGIFRLQPGESILVRPDTHHVRRYHVITLPDSVHRGSPDEVAAGFRDVFTHAVRHRMEASLPVGSMLSGGLDSSAIACVARDLRRAEGGPPLPTFSLVFPRTTVSDESAFIRAVTAAGGLDPRFIDADQISPLDHVDAIVAAIDEPYHGAPLPYQWATYHMAKAAGVGVLFDGSGGDSVVCHGLMFLADLVRRGRLLRMLRELRGLTANFNTPRSFAVREFIVNPLVPAWLRRARRALVGHTARVPTATFVSPELAERVALRDRFEAFWHSQPPPRNDREYHLRDLLDHLPRDLLELSSAAHGVEQRCPFFDLRVIEYCLAVPSSHKMENGLTRMLTRRALADVLPPAKIVQTGKAVPGASLLWRFLTADRERVASVLTSEVAESARRYLDLDALRSAWRSLEAQAHPSPAYQPSVAVWQQMDQIRKAVVLLIWLDAAGVSD